MSKKTTPPKKGVSRKGKKSAAEKRSVGQPTKYRPEYCEQIVSMFNVEASTTVRKVITTKSGSTIEEPMEVATNLPVLEDFARKVKVTVRTLQNWRKDYPEFDEAYEQALDSQRRLVLINGMAGRYSPAYACLFAKTKMGYVEKVEITGAEGGPIKQEHSVAAETEARMKRLLERMNLTGTAA